MAQAVSVPGPHPRLRAKEALTMVFDIVIFLRGRYSLSTCGEVPRAFRACCGHDRFLPHESGFPCFAIPSFERDIAAGGLCVHLRRANGVGVTVTSGQGSSGNKGTEEVDRVSARCGLSYKITKKVLTVRDLQVHGKSCRTALGTALESGSTGSTMLQSGHGHATGN